jgi:hypothetical protein
MKTKAANTVGVIYHHSTLHAMEVMNRVWFDVTGHHARITGLGEEGHSATSLHYGTKDDIRCRAFDVDADKEHCTKIERIKINNQLKKRLGSGEFDIVWEHLNSTLAHLHIEVDPKGE